MTARGAAVVAALLVWFTPTVAAADPPLNGIAIGPPVAALAAALGDPVSVASEDTGNRFVFPGGTTAKCSRSRPKRGAPGSRSRGRRGPFRSAATR